MRQARRAGGSFGSFSAWVGTSGGDPASRFTKATVPYARVDGEIVAQDWTDLTDGTLDFPINVDEQGNAVIAGFIWSNVATDGTFNDCATMVVPETCVDYTDGTATASGGVGSVTAIDATWTEFGCGLTCNAALRLLCVEQ